MGVNKAIPKSNAPLQNTFDGMFQQNNLPDDFIFRQNESRCDDLEVEERALMNLAAQELDQLRLIQKLP